MRLGEGRSEMSATEDQGEQLETEPKARPAETKGSPFRRRVRLGANVSQPYWQRSLTRRQEVDIAKDIEDANTVLDATLSTQHGVNHPGTTKLMRGSVLSANASTEVPIRVRMKKKDQ